MRGIIAIALAVSVGGLATASGERPDREQGPRHVAEASGDTLHADCTFDSLPLHGKVQVVDAFPDIKVQKVKTFPDLRVQWVDALPDECGEWQEVDALPDFKIQIVHAFPDLKIQIVENFPGLGGG